MTLAVGMAIPEKLVACVSPLQELRDEPAASQVQSSWAEDQLARLNLWADSLGVFAQGDFSITRRLAKNAQVSRVVKQLLSALSANIIACRLRFPSAGWAASRDSRQAWGAG